MSQPSHVPDPDKADLLLQHARMYVRDNVVRETVLVRLLEMHEEADGLGWLVGQLTSSGVMVRTTEVSPGELGPSGSEDDLPAGEAENDGEEDEADDYVEPPGSEGTPVQLTSEELVESVRAAREFLAKRRAGQVAKSALLNARLEVGLAALMRQNRWALSADLPANAYHSLDGEAREAFDALTCHNLRLAWKVSQGYMGRGLDLEDVQSFAVLGLLRAVRRFDAARGYKFSTYATWWIRQHITRGLADEGALIRLPVHMHEKALKVRRAFDRLSRDTGRTSIAAVAQECGMTPNEVRRILDLARGAVSLHVVVGDDANLIDFIADDDLGPEAAAYRRARRDDLAVAVATLTDREADIIRLRYGLAGDEPQTLDTIGRSYGLTRERIRQIEGKALMKLRHPSRSEGLREYVDWSLPGSPDTSG